MTPNGPSSEVYARRRRRLLERLDKAVLFVPAVEETAYSNDVHYRYRQNSNVRYLTGFEEPAAVILARTGGAEDGFILCVRPRDDEAAVWTGDRIGIEGAVSEYGADRAFPLDQAFEVLERCLREAEQLWYVRHRDGAVNSRILEAVHRANAGRQRSGRRRLRVCEADELIEEMRLIKEAEEIEILRTACRHTVRAHEIIMEELRPGMGEAWVAARIEFLLREAGCTGPAYGTIAAGGTAATILHYVRNDRTLREGELLLLDAGGEYGGYAADVTRTIPVGAEFTSAQAELYDTVVAAQQAAIERAAPGETHERVHQAALEVLVDGMIAAGLLKGSRSECIENESYKRFYMHGTSHWLGMDVHDAGDYRRDGTSRTLEPGMVLTVEPGIYVAAAEDVPERLHGIGIRVEDDVLITADGREVLSSGLPKRREDLEHLRARALA